MDNILNTLQNHTDLTTLLSYCLTCKALYSWYSQADHVFGGYRLSRNHVKSAIRLSFTSSAVQIIGNVFEAVYTLLYSLYNRPHTTALVSMSDTPNNYLAQSILAKWEKFRIYKYNTIITQPSTLLYYSRVIVLDFDNNISPERLARALYPLSVKVFYLSDKVNGNTSSVLAMALNGLRILKLSNLNVSSIHIVNHRSITQYITTSNIVEYAYGIDPTINLLLLQQHIINNICTSLIIVDIPGVLVYGDMCICSYSNLYSVLPYVNLRESAYVVVSTINNVNIDDIKRILLTQCCLSECQRLSLHIIDIGKILSS